MYFYGILTCVSFFLNCLNNHQLIKKTCMQNLSNHSWKQIFKFLWFTCTCISFNFKWNKQIHVHAFNKFKKQKNVQLIFKLRPTWASLLVNTDVPGLISFLIRCCFFAALKTDIWILCSVSQDHYLYSPRALIHIFLTRPSAIYAKDNPGVNIAQYIVKINRINSLPLILKHKQVGETIFCDVGINLHTKWGTDKIDKLTNQLNDIPELKCIMGYYKKYNV